MPGWQGPMQQDALHKAPAVCSPAGEGGPRHHARLAGAPAGGVHRRLQLLHRAGRRQGPLLAAPQGLPGLRGPGAQGGVGLRGCGWCAAACVWVVGGVGRAWVAGWVVYPRTGERHLPLVCTVTDPHATCTSLVHSGVPGWGTVPPTMANCAPVTVTVTCASCTSLVHSGVPGWGDCTPKGKCGNGNHRRPRDS